MSHCQDNATFPTTPSLTNDPVGLRDFEETGAKKGGHERETGWEQGWHCACGSCSSPCPPSDSGVPA